MKKDIFISEIRGYTEEIVKEIADGEGQFRHENLTKSSVSELRQADVVCTGEKTAKCLSARDRKLWIQGEYCKKDQCQMSEMP